MTEKILGGGERDSVLEVTGAPDKRKQREGACFAEDLISRGGGGGREVQRKKRGGSQRGRDLICKSHRKKKLRSRHGQRLHEQKLPPKASGESWGTKAVAEGRRIQGRDGEREEERKKNTS